MRQTVMTITIVAVAGLLGNPGCGCGSDRNLLSGSGTFLALAGGGYGNVVDVVDVGSMTVVDTIPGAGGYRLALTPDGTRLYSTAGDELLYVSDAVSFSLITSFDPALAFGMFTSSELEAVCVNPSGAFAYVFDEQSTTNGYEVSTVTNTATRMIAGSGVFDEPENCFCDGSGTNLYMNDNANVWKFNTGTFALVLADSEPVGSDAHGLGLSADGARVYAAGVAGGMDVISTAAGMPLLLNIADGACSGSCGYYLERSRAGSRIYSVDEGTVLSVFDSVSNTLVTTVTLSTGSARGVATTPDGSIILIATSSGLIRMDAASLTETGFLPGRYQSIVVK